MHIDRAYYVHVRNHVSWYVPSFEKIMTLRTVTRASGKAFVVLQNKYHSMGYFSEVQIFANFAI